MLLKLPVFHVVLNMLRAQEKAKENPEHLNLIIITISFAVCPLQAAICPGGWHRGRAHPASRSTVSWVAAGGGAAHRPPALELGRFSSRATRFFGQESPLGNRQCSSTVWLHPGAAQRGRYGPLAQKGDRLTEK